MRGRLRVDLRHLRASARGTIVSPVLLTLVDLWRRQKLGTRRSDVIHHGEPPARTHSPGDARGHGDHGARRQVAARLARQKGILGELILSTAPLLLQTELPWVLRPMAAAELSVAGVQLPSRSSVQMGDVFDDLGVARVGFRHGARRQSARRVEASSLHLHALHLALLRFRELRGDDDETQVDQEEGPDLRRGGRVRAPSGGELDI